MAGKKPRRTGQVIAVRMIPNVEEDLYRIQQLRHENFVSVYEIFAFESSFYIISERMQVSLDYVVEKSRLRLVGKRCPVVLSQARYRRKVSQENFRTEEAHRGAAALSPNRSIALAISGGSVVTRRANPERCASRAKQTAPLPGRAAFAIRLVALSAGLQVSTPSLSQASQPIGILDPHMALLSNAPQRSGAPAIGPPPLSLSLVAAHSRRHFFRLLQ